MFIETSEVFKPSYSSFHTIGITCVEYTLHMECDE